MKKRYVSRNNEIGSILEVMCNIDKYQENSNNGLVILLNSAWGTGKTTFLHELLESIKSYDDMEVFNIYNAYEYDCYDNAYIPFFASIAEKIQLETKFTNFIKSVGVGSTSAITVCAFSVVRSVFKNKFGVDINDVVADLDDELSNYKDDYLSDYNSFCEYKSYIKKKMNEVCRDKTQIFIIDELDRCKPSFAMETLEIVKHFFDIKNCIFIISVDKKQLEESVKVIYGSINSEKYFSKLFDYQFNLLPIRIKDVVDISELGGDNIFLEYSSNIFDKLNISLRDGKKILNDLLGKSYGWKVSQKKFMLFLFILKYTDLSFYNAIINGDYSKYKKIIEEHYDSELEKYNKVFNIKIDGFSYSQIIEFICRKFGKTYSSLGDSSDNSSVMLGGELIRVSVMEEKLKEFLPLYDEILSVKDNIIGIIG